MNVLKMTIVAAIALTLGACAKEEEMVKDEMMVEEEMSSGKL